MYSNKCNECGANLDPNERCDCRKLEASKTNILGLIPFGKDNAISREKLEILTGKSDRCNREQIKEECKKQNKAVVSLSNGKGYFRPLPHEIEEVLHQRNENRKRAMSILENNKPLDNWLKINNGQTEMDLGA